MNNPGMLIQAFKNPNEFLNQVMQNSQLMQNPIAKNAIEMMQRGDRKGTEETARNLLKERGIDPDEALRQVKSMFRG